EHTRLLELFALQHDEGPCVECHRTGHTWLKARAAGPDAARARPSGGAVAPLATAGARPAVWEDAGWTGGWLAETAAREDSFQDALHRLTRAAAPGRTPAAGADPEPAGLLRAFGFTVLHTPEDPR
ncbi:hypothetical protein ABZZ17_08040, partial [Streptomyces sp. NPDC006512]